MIEHLLLSCCLRGRSLGPAYAVIQMFSQSIKVLAFTCEMIAGDHMDFDIPFFLHLTPSCTQSFRSLTFLCPEKCDFSLIDGGWLVSKHDPVIESRIIFVQFSKGQRVRIFFSCEFVVEKSQGMFQMK